MQVVVHHVDAKVARPGDAEDGVEVGAVVVHEPAGLMDKVDNFDDVLVPEAEGIGIRDHDAGGVRPDQLTDLVNVAVAAIVGGDRHDVESGHLGGRGVRAVRGVRDQHLGPAGVTALLVVGVDDEAAGELAVRASGRLERDGLEAGDLREHLLQLVHQLERALRSFFRLVRMKAGEAGIAGDFLVDLRVVLHGA